MATTFSTFNKAPGVYIQEITLPGPLPQVSTSIAAFVGPAQTGPLNQPTLLTTLKQFNAIFGSYIETPYRCYAAHAINGFFNEGGQQCYFVRVGNGKAAWANLLDQANAVFSVAQSTTLSALVAAAATSISVVSATGISGGTILKLTSGATTENATVASVAGTTITLTAGLANGYAIGATVQAIIINAQQPTLRVTALQEGSPTVATTVEVAAATLASTTTPESALTAASGTNSVTVASAASFLPGDVVVVAQPAPSVIQETATIASIAANVITFTANLTNAYAATSTVSFSLPAGSMSIRVASVSGFQPGSYVQFSWGTPAVVSYDVVRVVNPVTNVLTITNGLTNAYSMSATAPTVTVTSMEFTLTVVSANAGTEVFSNLAMDPRHSRYYANIVNSKAVTVGPPLQPDTTQPPLNNPAPMTSPQNLSGGALDDLKSLATTAYQAGIDSLQKYDVDLLCVPDAVNSNFTIPATQAIQAYMVAHCERLQDRFAILDCAEPQASDITFSAVQNQRQALNSNNGFAALYFPWIGITSPFGTGQIFVPPSGHTAGVYSFNDNTFDVAHAPANEAITSALSVEVLLSDGDQGPLNQEGINVIRSFPSQGILIWGARTIAPPDQTAWTYVNVRRLLLYIEKTIREGTRFAVFQPNNLTLWQQVKRLITDFLTGLWSAGDLFGATPDQAFLVRVDATLNTPAVVALGQMIAQITVVPTHPAEFVVFKVIQDPTGASLQESTAG
jgi:phage tail sheath protein FI